MTGTVKGGQAYVTELYNKESKPAVAVYQCLFDVEAGTPITIFAFSYGSIYDWRQTEIRCRRIP